MIEDDRARFDRFAVSLDDFDRIRREKFFNASRDLVAKFPAATLRIRGAVPFAVLGKAALVAVLNPADESLRAELSAAMPCRFYIAEAGAVESALASLFPSEEAQG